MDAPRTISDARTFELSQIAQAQALVIERLELAGLHELPLRMAHVDAQRAYRRLVALIELGRERRPWQHSKLPAAAAGA
jgi:hypothetical protein